MKTRPSQQNDTNDTSIFKEQYLLCVLNKNASRMLFSLVSQFVDVFGLPSFVIVMSYYLVIFLYMQKLPLLRA
jgi:hypothetical protein